MILFVDNHRKYHSAQVKGKKQCIGVGVAGKCVGS